MRLENFTLRLILALMVFLFNLTCLILGRLEIWIEYIMESMILIYLVILKKNYVDYMSIQSLQRAIAGVLLQAVRLDKKDKALRLVVLDDYTQTSRGKALLETICQTKNLNSYNFTN